MGSLDYPRLLPEPPPPTKPDSTISGSGDLAGHLGRGGVRPALVRLGGFDSDEDGAAEVADSPACLLLGPAARAALAEARCPVALTPPTRQV